eukprot:286254-Pleurochrysis_carterae.AAC.2
MRCLCPPGAAPPAAVTPSLARAALAVRGAGRWAQRRRRTRRAEQTPPPPMQFRHDTCIPLRRNLPAKTSAPASG